MSQILGFVGVDRHIDPKIRDLGGAKRDATALSPEFTTIRSNGQKVAQISTVTIRSKCDGNSTGNA